MSITVYVTMRTLSLSQCAESEPEIGFEHIQACFLSAEDPPADLHSNCEQLSGDSCQISLYLVWDPTYAGLIRMSWEF